MLLSFAFHLHCLTFQLLFPFSHLILQIYLPIKFHSPPCSLAVFFLRLPPRSQDCSQEFSPLFSGCIFPHTPTKEPRLFSRPTTQVKVVRRKKRWHLSMGFILFSCSCGWWKHFNLWMIMD